MSLQRHLHDLRFHLDLRSSLLLLWAFLDLVGFLAGARFRFTPVFGFSSSTSTSFSSLKYLLATWRELRAVFDVPFSLLVVAFFDVAVLVDAFFGAIWIYVDCV